MCTLLLPVTCFGSLYLSHLQAEVLLTEEGKTWYINKVRELMLEGLYIMHLYQLDKQSLLFGRTEKAAWKLRRKRPELFANNSWNLHHDIAPTHTALSEEEF